MGHAEFRLTSPSFPLEDIKVSEAGVLRILLRERVKIGDFLQESKTRPIRLNPASELTVSHMRTWRKRFDVACINDDISECGVEKAPHIRIERIVLDKMIDDVEGKGDVRAVFIGSQVSPLERPPPDTACRISSLPQAITHVGF